MDAYLTAIVVPIYLQAVLLTGLSYVLILAFVRVEMAKSGEDAWALVGTSLWLIGGLLTVVAVGGSLFAPGLSTDKAKLAEMLVILMFFVPLTGLGSLTKGIQNARNRFFWSATFTAIERGLVEKAEYGFRLTLATAVLALAIVSSGLLKNY
jgi:peptidoglycan biosynthesis protein MviN/MurJ (putative lipid II flippase)